MMAGMSVAKNAGEQSIHRGPAVRSAANAARMDHMDHGTRGLGPSRAQPELHESSSAAVLDPVIAAAAANDLR